MHVCLLNSNLLKNSAEYLAKNIYAAGSDWNYPGDSRHEQVKLNCFLIKGFHDYLKKFALCK